MKPETQQMQEAEQLLIMFTKVQAIFFCEELGKRLPNINTVSPAKRNAADKYMQFWVFGVVSAINKLNIEAPNASNL